MVHNKAAIFRLILATVLTAGLFCALRAAFAAADELQILCGSGYGIRAGQALTAEQRTGAAKAAAEQGAAIAFWGETAGTVQAKRAEKDPAPAVQAEAAVIVCMGEPALAFGAAYPYGRAPAATEAAACAVSQPLAERLWGAPDAAGQTLWWQGRAYTVTGVAEGEGLWMLCAAPDDAELIDLNAIELTGLPAGDPRAAARAVAAAAGLSESDDVPVPGGTLAAAAGLLAWLPLALAGLALAARAAAGLWREVGLFCGKAAREAALFLAAVLLALALPRLLAVLPAWLIPDRWSDFAFWRTLLALPGQTLRELLRAAPTVRDAALQWHLVRTAAADGAALLFTAALAVYGRRG